MRNFKELEVWKEGRILAKDIYLLSNTLPQDEKYGLISQIKRCVISIPSNIAEGCAKDSQKDFEVSGNTDGFQAEISMRRLFGFVFKVSINSVTWSMSSLFQLRH